MLLTRPSDDRPTDDEVLAFLRGRHGVAPTDLEPLSGGFWSAAYGYRLGDDELVLRMGSSPDGFRADQLAMRYGSASLPIPEVLWTGDGLGRRCAISRRHHGRVLETVGADERDRLGPTVVELLRSLRDVADTGAVAPPWHEWLLDGLTDRPGGPTSGWRALVGDDPIADRTFREADRQVRDLLDACPDRRQLVHGDLLHANVLVTPSADAVTAVFSWKCSTWGDAIYDLAWCTFWGRWHPGIGALDLWNRVAPTLAADDLPDAALRHHAYELHIGASHLGWYAATGDHTSLRWTAAQLDELLEHGPQR